MGNPVWALAGVRRLCWQGSPGLEWSGRGLCPRSGPGSLLPYVPQSRVPRDWIGAGAEPHFLMGLFEFPKFSFLSSLYILDISPLSDLGLLKIVSQSVGGLFVLLTVSFALQKL